MAFVVEDGTGLSTATSYLSVADADSYLSERGLDSVWTTKTTAQKQAAILQATEFLDAKYIWIGSILNTGQGLGWPRVDAYDADNRDYNSMVPVPIERATAELAIEAMTARLNPTKTRSDYTTREKVGELEVEYQSGAPAGDLYPYIDALLVDLVIGTKSGGSQVNLRRV